jgi:hypothetical protein
LDNLTTSLHTPQHGAKADRLGKAARKGCGERGKGVHIYNEKLMQTSYDNGDIYNDERHGAAKLEWEIRFVNQK